MTTWRHAGTGEWCDHDVAPRGPDHEPEPCGCSAPLPDPASPCGYWVEWGIYERATVLCGYPGHTDGGQHLHPYVPTLCATCHHPIVEAGPYAETRRLRREFEDFAVATPEDTDA